MQERRQAVRQRSLLGGRIEFSRTHTFDCVIRNFTSQGARLECSGFVTVPHLFDLFVIAHGERHPARMMWRNDTAIGVEFIGATGLDSTTSSQKKPFLTLISSNY